MSDRLEKRTLRRKIGQYGWFLLVYYLLINYAVMYICEIDLLHRGLQAVIQSDSWTAFEAGMTNAMEEVLYGNGWGYIIACVLAVGLIPLWKGKEFICSMFQTRRDMSIKAFFALLCLFLSGQMVFQILAIIEEALLNLIGLSILESMEMASAGADTFSMFLYMSLGAPVVEEIVFRGVIMNGLKPFGKRFAIIASAVLFGLFHGNLVQSPYAFVVGLILGYTAMEYSILWAMVLHMLNNLVLGDMLVRLTSFLPEHWASLIFGGVILTGSIAAVVILIRNRGKIRQYRSTNRIDGRYLRAFLTSAPNIILAAIMGLSAVSMLFLA